MSYAGRLHLFVCDHTECGRREYVSSGLPEGWIYYKPVRPGAALRHFCPECASAEARAWCAADRERMKQQRGDKRA